MTPLPTRIKNALNEGRILILGAQVLLGFQYRAALEPGFARLSRIAQVMTLVGLALLVGVIALLITPAVWHRVVERGHDSARLHRVTTACIAWALTPIALILGIDTVVALERMLGVGPAAAAGGLATASAVFAWSVIPRALRRSTRRRAGGGEMSESTETPLEDRIEHALTETRVVLPGVQALLGFQFAAMLMDGFTKLPPVSRWIHVGGLACVALATILLITPAAYHRIAENGEDTERVHRVTSRLLLWALVPLALSLAADVFVVASTIVASTIVAIILGAATLVGIVVAWVIVPWRGRRRRRRHDPLARAA